MDDGEAGPNAQTAQKRLDSVHDVLLGLVNSSGDMSAVKDATWRAVLGIRGRDQMAVTAAIDEALNALSSTSLRHAEFNKIKKTLTDARKEVEDLYWDGEEMLREEELHRSSMMHVLSEDMDRAADESELAAAKAAYDKVLADVPENPFFRSRAPMPPVAAAAAAKPHPVAPPTAAPPVAAALPVAVAPPVPIAPAVAAPVLKLTMVSTLSASPDATTAATAESTHKAVYVSTLHELKPSMRADEDANCKAMHLKSAVNERVDAAHQLRTAGGAPNDANDAKEKAFESAVEEVFGRQLQKNSKHFKNTSHLLGFSLEDDERETTPKRRRESGDDDVRPERPGTSSSTALNLDGPEHNRANNDALFNCRIKFIKGTHSDKTGTVVTYNLISMASQVRLHDESSTLLPPVNMYASNMQDKWEFVREEDNNEDSKDFVDRLHHNSGASDRRPTCCMCGMGSPPVESTGKDVHGHGCFNTGCQVYGKGPGDCGWIEPNVATGTRHTRVFG